MGWAGILAFKPIATAKVHGRGPVRVQPSWTPRGAVVIARRSEHEPFPVVDGDTPKPKALKRDVCWHLERECVGLPRRRPREVHLVLGTGASPASCNVHVTEQVIDPLRARKEAEGLVAPSRSPPRQARCHGSLSTPTGPSSAHPTGRHRLAPRRSHPGHGAPRSCQRRSRRGRAFARSRRPSVYRRPCKGGRPGWPCMVAHNHNRLP
mmetsp:Transcript_78884/g.255875  ORF Transcript_78884/g.255875 Transcript_78884/m.255875 type:complete len:208 (-) Transcript_78884:278-901(-)